MNLFRLSIAYIRQQMLRTLLNVLLLSLGIGTIVILLLFSYQFEENLNKNAAGIDVVVGSKGSPIQLILSSIFHMDAPTGNISLQEAKTILDNPAVGTAIPLALGDNYRGYRIVGTTKEYADHYQVSLEAGDYWSSNFEVIIGAHVAEEERLSIGSEIISSHGFSSAGHQHSEKPLSVVGILEESNTVIDRLILTGVPTVWAVHDHADEEEHEHTDEDNRHEHEDEDETHVNGQEEHEEHINQDAVELVNGNSMARFAFMTPENMEEELTSLLITYTSPIAAAMFPRYVNSETDMQAAAPGFEIARLLNLLGIGLGALRIFGIILILSAALGVFIALYNALKERQYDLAILRTMGGTRSALMSILMLEGLILCISGCLLGFVIGHGAIAILGEAFSQARQVNLSAWILIPSEAWLLLLAVSIGIISSLIPAVQAYRTDISAILSQQKFKP
ncbi:MAG: ABC transporter permease [Bacteroidetes bacterium]|jgi:putative ABC transport system permease protein|nr:ABC transporter permease [Bacteroidota bacterium]